MLSGVMHAIRFSKSNFMWLSGAGFLRVTKTTDSKARYACPRCQVPCEPFFVLLVSELSHNTRTFQERRYKLYECGFVPSSYKRNTYASGPQPLRR
jgi:hypothetical protein